MSTPNDGMSTVAVAAGLVRVERGDDAQSWRCYPPTLAVRCVKGRRLRCPTTAKNQAPHRSYTQGGLLIDDERFQRFLVGFLEGVDADNQLALGIHFALVGESSLGNLPSEETGLDGVDHAALLLDPLEVIAGLLLHLLG